MTDFAELTLGKDAEELTLERSAEHLAATLSMVSQCHRELDITSRYLDPPIYDNTEFLTALKMLVRRSSHSRIRILLIEPRAVVSRGHRLLDVAANLSSFIHIRKPGPDHGEFNEAWLIADKTGVIRRPLAERYEGIVNFNDKLFARELNRQFEDLWEYGREDPNLRRLIL